MDGPNSGASPSRSRSRKYSRKMMGMTGFSVHHSRAPAAGAPDGGRGSATRTRCSPKYIANGASLSKCATTSGAAWPRSARSSSAARATQLSAQFTPTAYCITVWRETSGLRSSCTACLNSARSRNSAGCDRLWLKVWMAPSSACSWGDSEGAPSTCGDDVVEAGACQALRASASRVWSRLAAARMSQSRRAGMRCQGSSQPMARPIRMPTRYAN